MGPTGFGMGELIAITFKDNCSGSNHNRNCLARAAARPCGTIPLTSVFRASQHGREPGRVYGRLQGLPHGPVDGNGAASGICVRPGALSRVRPPGSVRPGQTAGPSPPAPTHRARRRPRCGLAGRPKTTRRPWRRSSCPEVVGVAGDPPVPAPGSERDFPPGHLGANVPLRAVGVERRGRPVQHPQEFGPVLRQPPQRAVEVWVARPASEDPVETRRQFPAAPVAGRLPAGGEIAV